MTGSQTLIARAAMGITFAGTGLVLACSRKLLTQSPAAFQRFLFIAFALSRLGLYSLLFLVLHIAPRGDIPAYYIGQADAVLAYQLPYRDFASSYAPLHPFLDAIFVSAWHSPLALILFPIAIEILALPVWLRLARIVAPERTARIALLLYLASPISLQYVTVDGQDNVVIASLLAVALWLLVEHRQFLSGLLVGFSMSAVKFLPLLFVPIFFFCTRRRWRWMLGAATIPAVVYGSFILLHANILDPLAEEGGLRGCGNLGYVLESLLGIDIPSRVLDVFLLVVLLGIIALVALHANTAEVAPRTRILLFGMAALVLALVLLAKKSWPPYLMLALVPLCLLIADEDFGWHRRAAFALFQVVAVTEHSIWATHFLQIDARGLHDLLLQHRLDALFFLLVQVLLTAGYGWLLIGTLRQIVASPTYIGEASHTLIAEEAS